MIRRDSSSPESGIAVAPGIGLGAYASNELSRAIDLLSWHGARRHTGVHQARKSMRRARATIALGASALGQGARPIDRELGRINRSLSTVRDAQSLVESLARLSDRHTGPDATLLLKRARRAAVQQRIARTRAEMQDDPDFTGRRAALTVLMAGLQALPWQAVLEQDLLTALRSSASKAKAASKQARRSGRDNDWHRWRRRARRLSQQHRALGELVALPNVPKDQHKALAVLLGEAQDYALLIDHCGTGAPFNDVDRPALQALAKKGLKRTRARIAKAATQLGHASARGQATQAPPYNIDSSAW